MVNVLLDVSAHDGRQHYEPGVVALGDLTFAARVISRGHGAVLVVIETEGGDPAAAEADLAQTLAALQIKPDADVAPAIAAGMERRDRRIAKAAAKQAEPAEPQE